MRGLLRITSQRTPYLRAGLSFTVREPIEVDIRDLDGERLLELAGDPVLTVLIGDRDGTFKPLPAIDEGVTASHAQDLIDAIKLDLPPRDEPAAETVGGSGSTASAELDALCAAFELPDAAAIAERLRDLERIKGEQADQILRLTDQLTAANGRVTTAEAATKDAVAAQRTAEQRAEAAEAKAVKAVTPAPKPAKKSATATDTQS